jgi:HNH endonuclease
MIANSNNTQINCGTYAGYSKHSKLKEPPCQPCRDARNAYRSAYYKAHPEKKRAMDIRYLEKHPGQRNKYDQKYRDNNRDKTRAATLKWNKENPERMNAAARKRRAVKLQNGWEPYTEAQVLDLYGVDCYLCHNPINLQAPRRIGKENGWELGLHIDHVVPIIAGGADTLENVRPTHAICNMKKGDKMPEDFEIEIDPSLFEEDFDDVDLEDLDDFEDEEEEDE